MTEKKIQNALFDRLTAMGYKLITPNYTPRGWFESDVFAITKNDRAVEFEIKISRSDFKADAKKGPSGHKRMFSGETKSKHERLTLADTNGPTRFIYVVPTGLIQPDEVPEWAGLWYVREVLCNFNGTGRVKFDEIKKAPKLHNDTVCPRVTGHAIGVFYWRFWSLRRGMKETTNLNGSE